MRGMEKEGKSEEGPKFRFDLSFVGTAVNELHGLVNGQCKFTFHCENIRQTATIPQDRKQKIRELLANKNNANTHKSIAPSLQPHQSADHLPIRSSIHITNVTENLQRERVMRVSQEREDRSRTRDRAVQNPASRIKDYIIFNEAQAKKLSFQPKFNYCDNIFAQYKDIYSILSGKHEGFMIVNSSPCPARKCFIKFRVHGLSRDGENDCAVGITFKPIDLVKSNRKNPVDKCMRYFLGSQKLWTGKNSNLISGNLEEEVMLMIDLPNGKFAICTHKKIIFTRSIPNQFLAEELFICIELKNKARIQLL